MKELIELIPIHVRPQMGNICEKCYKHAHKIVSVGVQLDELKVHLKKSQSAAANAPLPIPPQITIKKYTIQVCKSFVGKSQLVNAEQALEQAAWTLSLTQLEQPIQVKTA